MYCPFKIYYSSACHQQGATCFPLEQVLRGRVGISEDYLGQAVNDVLAVYSLIERDDAKRDLNGLQHGLFSLSSFIRNPKTYFSSKRPDINPKVANLVTYLDTKVRQLEND